MSRLPALAGLPGLDDYPLYPSSRRRPKSWLYPDDDDEENPFDTSGRQSAVSGRQSAVNFLPAAGRPAQPSPSTLQPSESNPFGDPAGQHRRTEHPAFRQLVDEGPEAIESSIREYLKQAPPEDVAENPRTWWQSALEYLDVPRNAVATLVFNKLFGVQPSSKEEFAGMRKVYGSDVLRSMGWKPESTIGKVGQFLAGLALDFATDPLTWIGLGGVTRGVQKVAATAVERGAAGLAEAANVAKQAGKGLEVATKVDDFGRPLERAFVKPKGLPGLVERVEAAEKAATEAGQTLGREELATGVRRAAAELPAEELYKGPWGFGIGTHTARTTPLGHLIVGPPLLLGKAATAGTRLGGKIMQQVPGLKTLGKGMTELGELAELPLDVLGKASEKIGTPFSALPEAQAFIPFREVPGLGDLIERTAKALDEPGIVRDIAAPIRRAGALAAEAAAKIGIGPKTVLMAEAARAMKDAERRQRWAEALKLEPREERIGQLAKETGIAPENLKAVGVIGREFEGIIAKAVATGDPVQVRKVLGELRAKASTYLARAYPVDKVARNVDDVMELITESNVPGEMLPGRPRQGTGTHRRIEDLFDAATQSPGTASRFWTTVGPVGEEQARFLKQKTGLDVPPDATHIVDGAAIRHILEGHGEGRERVAGQIPITREDFARLPDVITNPDDVAAARVTPQGLAAVVYRKRVNGEIYYVAEHRVGQNKMAAKSMWKVKATSPGDAQTSETFPLMSKAPRATGEAGLNIPQESEPGKPPVEGTPTRGLFGQGVVSDQPLTTGGTKPLLFGGEDVTVKPEKRPAGPADIEGQGTLFLPAGAKGKAAATGAAAVKRKLLEIHDRMKDVFEADAGYVQGQAAFENLGETAEGARHQAFYTPDQVWYPESHKGEAAALRGLLPKYLQSRVRIFKKGETPPARTGEELEYELRNAGVADPQDYLAKQIIANAEHGEGGRIKRTLQFIDESPDQAGPEAVYWARVQRNMEAGRPLAFVAAKGYEPKLLNPAELHEGQTVTVAGDVYDVLKRTGEGEDAAVELWERGRERRSEWEHGDTVDAQTPMYADAGGITAADEAAAARAAEQFAARYRSPGHVTAAKIVREAGLPEREAQLFDASVADMRPEDLEKIDFKAAAGGFAGMYEAVKKAITYGKGNLRNAGEALHEIGHFGFDHILPGEDQATWRAWWQTRNVNDRITYFRRSTGNELRARYLAADPSLTDAELAKIGTTREVFDRVLANPEREGFAQVFGHYAMSRRLADPEVATIFDRVIQAVRNVWETLRFRKGEADQKIGQMLERMFEPAARKRELPESAINLKLPGTTVDPMGRGGRNSMAFREGKNGDAEAARKWAAETITTETAAKLVDSFTPHKAEPHPETLLFVPVPSATGRNAISAAMAERLAKLTGGQAMPDLLASNVIQDRVPKGTLRRIANGRNFVVDRFPGDVPAEARIILVDDGMYSGGTFRDATQALQQAGLDVTGAVTANVQVAGRTGLRPNPIYLNQIRAKAGDELWNLERAAGRPIQELTAAEAKELADRLMRGEKPKQIAALIDEARRAPSPTPMELERSPSSIARTRGPLDDVAQDDDLLLERLRDLIEAEGIKPSARGIIEWAKANMTPSERQEYFGAVKIWTAKLRPEVEKKLEGALLRLGYGLRGQTWDKLLARLEVVERGQTGRVGIGHAAGIESPAARAFIETDPATNRPRLTDEGKWALGAMREAMRVGGDPAHVERTLATVTELTARVRTQQRTRGTVSPELRLRLSRAKSVLKRMGLPVEDEPAMRDAIHNREVLQAERTGATPPPTPPSGRPTTTAGPPGRPRMRVPTPEEIWSGPVAEVVRMVGQMGQEVERELRTADVRVPDFNKATVRGISHVPHMLDARGGAKTVVGRWLRSTGMSWESEFRKLQQIEAGRLAREPGARTAYDQLVETIYRENEGRKAKGLPPIDVPPADADIPRAIAEILDKHFPDMKAPHGFQLFRAWMRESVIQEVNSIAGETGMAFLTDPVEIYRRRWYDANLAIAGADFLRTAIEKGAAEGWVVRLSPRGPVPDGFERITAGKFGNIAKGYAFAKDVAKEFKRFAGTMEKPHAIIRAFEWATSQWRTGVLSALGYTLPNLLSGVFQANEFDAFSHSTWSKAMSLLEDVANKRNLDAPLRDYIKGLKGDYAKKTVREFWNELTLDHAAVGEGLHGQELAEAAAEGVRSKWSVADAWRSAWQGESKLEKGARGLAGVYRDARGLHWNLGEAAYFKAFRALNTAVEDWMALGFIMERMRRGEGLAEAVTKKRLALNQSADLTDVEQRVFRRLIPFWGWAKGNAVLQFVTAMDKPHIPALVAKIRGNLEASMAGEETLPPSLRPEHVAGEYGVQLTGGAKPQFVNLTRTMPVKELALTPLSLLNLPKILAQEGLQRLNPFAKGTIEGVVNRDFYWDRPIDEYEGQQKTFLGVPMSPGSKRLARMFRPLNAAEQLSWRGMPTSGPEMAFGALQAAGVRAFPVDVARQVFDRGRRIDEQLGAIMRDMYRARVAAEQGGRDWRTDAEVVRLQGLYSDLIDERERLPLRSLRQATARQSREARAARKELKAAAVAG